MSSQLKLSLLALVSSAAAIPHYGHGGHSKFHQPSGGYGQPSGALPSGTATPIVPSGGFYPVPSNSTVPYPTGTGAASYPGELTTTVEETATSVTTLYSTIYMSNSKPAAGGDYPASSVGEENVSSAPAGASCGGTVYVTATEKVTVTVTPGEAPSSSAASPSSAGEEKPSLSLPQKQPEVPSVTPSEAIYSILPVPSDKPEDEAPAPTPEPTKEAEVPAPSEPAAEPSSEVAPQPTPEPTPEPAPSSVVESSAAPSSSPAPKPSGSPSYSGTKRGLAYNDINLCQNFAGKASWAYNWASSPQGELPEGVKFVPMAWTKNEDAAKWLSLVDEAVEKGTDVVMGFNEVDHPDQAAMDAPTTCQKWGEYMNPIAEKHPDVTILGPSVTNGGQENWGLSWYKNFVSSCPDAVYHAANIHFYDIWEEGTLDRFKSHCEEAAKITGKKVWVTEFGLREGTTEQTIEFLKAVTEWMEGSDVVQGYAYFMVGTGANQLNAGNGLSPVGEVYASS